MLLGLDAPWPTAPEATRPAVLAVDLRTRDGDAAATPERVGDAVRRALDRDAEVFLKIDSLLRGEVGAAVRAALETRRRLRGPSLAVVAPAFPARGRRTRRGRVEVDGRPGERDVVAALAAAGLRSTVLDRGARLPPLSALPPGTDAVVVDCESDEDLARLTADVVARSDALPVGTAGLAAQLAAPSGPRAPGPTAVPSRVLVAFGSRAPEAVAQLSAAARAGLPLVAVDRRAAAGRRARELLATGCVLLAPGPAMGDGDPATVAGLLGEAVALAADRAEMLVLSGGHTAQVVLDRLGVVRLELLAELEPGVVLSRAPGHPWRIVTKAGAFGDEGALLRLLHPAPRPGRISS